MTPPFFLLHGCRCGAARRIRAFTLIELLVSMSVLLLLLVITMQMIKSVQSLTTGSARHMDADSQARLIFDRMSVDFSQIVKRLDVNYYFQKTAINQPLSGPQPHGNDQMAFYSESTGYYPTGLSGSVPKSNVSLVGYRIYEAASSSSNAEIAPRLERLNKALVWNAVTSGTNDAKSLTYTPRSMTFLPYPLPSPLPSSFSQTLPGGWPTVFSTATDPTSTPGGTPDMLASTDPDFQVLGEQVFRMEICFLVNNANPAKNTPKGVEITDTPYLPSPTSTPAVPTTTPVTVSTVLPYNGLRDVIAVVVTVAVLDNTSRLTVHRSDLDAAADLLPDQSNTQLVVTPGTTPPPVPPTQMTTTPALTWQFVVNSGTLVAPSGSPGLNATAASQVRIYERYFYLGNSQ